MCQNHRLDFHLEILSFTKCMNEHYTNIKLKVINIVDYIFTRKKLLIIDLAKIICSTDFQYFPDKALYFHQEADPLSTYLVTLNEDKWRILRQKLTPTFTSAKLKSLYKIIEKSAEEINFLKKEDVFEAKKFIARYTTDVIGSCTILIVIV